MSQPGEALMADDPIEQDGNLEDPRGGQAPLGGQMGRIAALGGLAFFIFASYAIARPALKSLLITHYTADALPIAWLGMAVAVTGTVMVYGRFAATIELTRLYRYVVVVCCVTLCLAMLLYQSGVTWAVFLLFIWKDVYIVVLAEMFWSIANSLFALKTAKWIYGIFCAMGSLGGMSANFAIGPLAHELGTAHAPWLIIPILLLSAGVVFSLPKVSPAQEESRPQVDYTAGLRLVRDNRYLLCLLGIIAFIQIAINLVDYQCSALVESNFAGADERTEVFGQIYGAIDIAALVMQLSAGLIITAIGVSGTLVGVPLILALCLIGFLVAPTFGVMAVAMVAGKSMDYSIFRAAKEMLYLPLSQAERTQGKAVIDMMTYRVAKGIASVAILGFAAWSAPIEALAVVALVAVLGWLALTRILIPLYRDANGTHH